MILVLFVHRINYQCQLLLLVERNSRNCSIPPDAHSNLSRTATVQWWNSAKTFIQIVIWCTSRNTLSIPSIHYYASANLSAVLVQKKQLRLLSLPICKHVQNLLQILDRVLQQLEVELRGSWHSHSQNWQLVHWRLETCLFYELYQGWRTCFWFAEICLAHHTFLHMMLVPAFLASDHAWQSVC